MNQEGKRKLLILGASARDTETAKRAKELGYYVIVTDNNKNYGTSPAKFEADEAWDISWSDVDALTAACLANDVAGVLAGFNEKKIEAQIKLCGRLGLPCDTTSEQLKITRDKLKFKALCQRHGIPIVEEYDEKEAPDNLPVIIKPTDLSGSFGIKVVTHKEDFNNAVEFSRSASATNRVIIEKFITGLTKIDVYYLVEDGVPYLMAASDTLMCPPTEGHEIMQGAWIFPSRNTGNWIRNLHPRVVDMIKSINVRYGYMTISAFACEDGNFKCFEAGLRLSGELSYKYIEAAYGYNYLDFIIERAMANTTPPNPGFASETDQKMLILNYYSHNGIIKDKKMPAKNFVDVLAATPKVLSHEICYPYVGMQFCTSTDGKDLIEQALRADKEIVLTDEDGRDMITFRFDHDSLAEMLTRHNWQNLIS